jgi:hypothetical protein
MTQGRGFFRAVFFPAIILTASAGLSWGQCSGTTTTQTCTFTGLAVAAAPDSKATTYPLQATPATLVGPVTNVSVSLTGITETGGSANASGAELLLVAPNGTQLVLWARGGDAFSAPPSSLIVDDAGTVNSCASTLTGASHVKSVVCGATHQLPTGGGAGGFPDGFPNVLSPGTSCTHTACVGANPPSVTMNNTFNAVANPNGTWSLYVINNSNSGLPGVSIHFTGWTLTVTTSGAAAAATTTAVSPANTPVTRTPPNPSSPATITATVSSTSTVNGGTVSFFDNGSPVASCGAGNTTVVNGTATCIVTFSQEGIHPITASYSGNPGVFAPSASPANTPANVTVTNNTTVNGTSYCNQGNIAIPATGSNFGVSAPYPSQIFVGVNGSPNLTGVITNLTVDLKQIHHQQSDSPSLLLVSPAGTPYMLMALAYSSTGGGPVDITLSDAGASQLPAGPSFSLMAGTFRPADYNQTASQDQGVFPAPAPQSGFLFPTPLGSSQPGGPSTIGQAFNGAGATGTWQLFVLNNAGGTGGITNGWCLNFTVNPSLHATTTAVVASPTQSYTTAPFTSKFPPVPANDFVMLTASVGSDQTVNAGSVTFTENGTNLTCAFGTSNPAGVSGGTAVCKTTFTTEGNHNIRATFHDAGGTFGDSHGNTLERADSHSTRNPAANTVSATTTYNYCNPGKITIPALAPSNVAAAPAGPYPSNIFINDLPGTINKVTLTIPDFVVQAVAIRDVTSLLVGPNQNSNDSLDLFSHAGTNAGVFTASYTFDDAGPSTMNQGGNPGSGTYFPFSFGSPTYPSLSPAGPYPPPAGSLNYASPSGSSTFGGIYGSGSGNTRLGTGTWSLFQQSTVAGTTIFEGNGTNQPGWCLNFTVNPPDISISTLTHSPATFKRTGAGPYTISTTIHNAGPGPTGGLISVADTLPAGMSASDFSAATAAGWTCSGTTTVTCTSLTAIAASGNASFSFNVSVANNTADSVTNSASVSGGGDNTPGNNSASDGPFAVNGTNLTVNKTHSDPFTQGQSGATYTITVHNSGAGGANSGAGVTTGAIQVTDSLPGAFTPTGFSGTGWTCPGPPPALFCTLNNPLAVGATSSPITLTLNVSNSAPTQVTNQGILTATTDQIGSNPVVHDDPTNITQVPASIVPNANTTPQSTGIGTPFGTNLGVTVKDAGGVSIPNFTVNLSAPGSGASGAFANIVNPPCGGANCQLTTNGLGIATAPLFTANGAPGSYNVQATAGPVSTSFALTNLPQITVTTSVNGPTVQVDGGTAFTGSQNFFWAPASTHSLATSSPQTISGIQYAFVNWSDGGAVTHNVSGPPVNTTYTATFDAVPTVTSFSVLFGSQSFTLGSIARTRLPWQITGIQVVFSKPITAGNMNSLSGVIPTGFSGLGTNTLTWTISPVSIGAFTATLAGSGGNALTDAAGTGLGNGAGASQPFKVLWGDFNDDGVVNSQDVVLVNAQRSQPYSRFADLNGDGVVNVTDVTIVRGQVGNSQP